MLTILCSPICPQNILNSANATLILVDSTGAINYISPIPKQQFGTECPTIGNKLAQLDTGLRELGSTGVRCDINKVVVYSRLTRPLLSWIISLRKTANWPGFWQCHSARSH